MATNFKRQDLEWNAWGQSLALRLANSVTGGLSFSPITKGTILVPALAGLF